MESSRFMEFRNKEIINMTNGVKIGFVDDIVFDTTTAKVLSIVVYGRYRFFGLFGRDDDIFIDWDDIEVIGEDTILVKNEGKYITKKPKKMNAFYKLFS